MARHLEVRGEKPRTASPATVVGRISEGLENVGRIAPGENLKAEKAAG